MDFRHLSDYHSLGTAIAWRGRVEMYVSASGCSTTNQSIRPTTRFLRCTHWAIHASRRCGTVPSPRQRIHQR
jgi:hypothetical protein